MFHLQNPSRARLNGDKRAVRLSDRQREKWEAGSRSEIEVGPLNLSNPAERSEAVLKMPLQDDGLIFGGDQVVFAVVAEKKLLQFLKLLQLFIFQREVD